jgi:penicillin-binding protein 2
MSRIGWERVEEREREQSEDVGVRGRLYFLRFIIIIVLGLLLYRVFWLQQTRGQTLQVQAEDNQIALLRADPPRGVIFDRYGSPLAVNQPSFNVTITPAFLPRDQNERQAIYERLSLLTGVPVTNTIQQDALIQAASPELVSTYTRLAEIYGAPARETLDLAGIVPQLPDSIAEIVQTYSFAPYLPAVITSGIPITLAYTIEQESIFLPGVRVIPQSLRYYPSGEFTSHLIGYMGPIPNENWITQLNYERDDRVGWSALESSMELELAGIKGERRIEVDWTGREIRQLGLAKEPTAGLNLHLTLDLDLQIKTYEILGEYMESNRQTRREDGTFPEIEQAVIVALNPQTGEVLAMVNYPTFDNNRFQTSVPVDYYLGLARNDYTPLVNHAISGTYPPGSTFKLVPAAAALQEGLISPNRFLFDPGQIEIPNRFAPNDPGRAQTFVCWNREGHGLMNMILGIVHSCDVYFYKISGGFNQDGEFVEGLGVDNIYRYGLQFGFGRVQGIELPLEAAGNLPTQAWKRQTQGEPWSTGDDYNLGIGQGYMTSTPLQVAQMAAVVANGGFLYRPTLIHHMTDEDGNIVVVNDSGQVVARAHPGPNGETILMDAQGNPLNDPSINIEFDAEGNYIFRPEVIDSLDVNREYLEIVAEGMRQVNQEGGTGTSYINWLDEFGVTTAGKTGTSEYCDNIAIKRGWCRFERTAIQPTHAFYVGYAPFENPEIVIIAFVFNGGEGSLWAAPVVRDVMAAYFQVDQFAPPSEEPAEFPLFFDTPVEPEPEDAPLFEDDVPVESGEPPAEEAPPVEDGAPFEGENTP